MYNLGMKNVIENNVKEIINKYKYSTLLTLIIFILFLLFGYSNNMKYQVYLNNKKVEFTHGIYNENNEQYIHIEDLIQVFKDNVYDDKISGKLIITTYDNLKKIDKNDKNYILKKENITYFNLKKVMLEIYDNVVLSKDKIYVSDSVYIDGITVNNRVELYDVVDGKVITLLQKSSKIKVEVNSLSEQDSKIINVLVDNKYYGYMLKNNVNYEYLENKVEEEKEKVVIVKADSKLENTTDIKKVDIVSINMFRLASPTTLSKLEYTNNIPDNVKVLATVNNGQKSSNFDADITTNMLNSESNRYTIIQKIVHNTKQLAGVNIDFANFKVSDKEKFTQFIKELAAVMHANNKIVVVNIPSNNYIDIEKISQCANYVIIQPYFERSTASKTSGPISSLNYVENVIKTILDKNIDEDKVILEIPAYSILWTERRGTVINAEVYNMKAMQLYINANNIQTNLDKSSGQNYINYTKGITTYKMWLEDEYSIIQKTKLANKYNLGGVSIFKSGMEIKNMYVGIIENIKNVGG